MKIRYPFAGLAAVLLILAACAKNSPPRADNTPSVATINGKAVNTDVFESYLALAARKPASEVPPEQRAQALDQFIAMQIAADLAVKSGLDKTTAVVSQLALARTNVLSEATLKKYMDEHLVTDAEVQVAYDTQVGAMLRQYHARQILVQSKAAADSIISKLNAGGDFAKIAEKESLDPTAKQGGDIGWVTPGAIMPSFGKALTLLDKGKFTQEPVQTQYGWHVIKVEDFRTPPLDQVKDQVKGFVQRQKLAAYFDELRKGAKVEKTAAAAPTAAVAPAEAK
jgi:peptidyl-prolyl cis-trans isomerase C